MSWLLLITIILSSVIINNQAYRDYYWRDYNGTIPNDAFVSKHANLTNYIGRGAFVRGYFVGNLEPGIITIYNKGSFDGYDKSYRLSTKNVQILCVGSNNELEWVNRKVATENDLTRVVYCGYEMTPEFSMSYVGRTVYNLIGRVVESKVPKLLSNNLGTLVESTQIFFVYVRETDFQHWYYPEDYDVLVYKKK